MSSESESYKERRSKQGFVRKVDKKGPVARYRQAAIDGFEGVPRHVSALHCATTSRDCNNYALGNNRCSRTTRLSPPFAFNLIPTCRKTEEIVSKMYNQAPCNDHILYLTTKPYSNFCTYIFYKQQCYY